MMGQGNTSALRNRHDRHRVEEARNPTTTTPCPNPCPREESSKGPRLGAWYFGGTWHTPPPP